MTARNAVGRRLFVVGLTGWLVAVGCGSGSTSATPASVSTPPLEETSQSSDAPEAAAAEQTSGSEAAAAPDDAQIAAALLWGPDEFPSDWTFAPHQRSADYKAGGDRLAACSGTVNVEAPVDIDAADFTNGTAKAGLGVAIHADAATVVTDFAAIDGPAFVDCTKAELIRALGADAQRPGVTVEVTKLAPPTGTPPWTVALRATVAQNGVALVVSDIILMGSGRTELSLAFTGRGAAFPEQLAGDLITNAAARLAANPT